MKLEITSERLVNENSRTCGDSGLCAALAPFLSEIDATNDRYGEHFALYGYDRCGRLQSIAVNKNDGRAVYKRRGFCTLARGRRAAGISSTATIHNPFPIFKVQLY